MPPAKKEPEVSSLDMNMRFYSRVMNTPKEAQRSFNNGRFSGTDINPMWRIQKLTELFGPAGQGWWTQNEKFELVPFEKTGEIAVFCTLELVYVDPGTLEVSKPIMGVGGNMFVVQRKSGLQLSDEAYKMAYTDALSIACKALGFSHDIYYSSDRTKYTMSSEDVETKQPEKAVPAKNQDADLDALKSRIQRAVQFFTKSMDAEQKTAFLNEVIVPAIGQEDYRACADATKLTALLDALNKKAKADKAA